MKPAILLVGVGALCVSCATPTPTVEIVGASVVAVACDPGSTPVIVCTAPASDSSDDADACDLYCE
jgi:hypothetical protein